MTHSRPYPKLALRKTAPTAQALHREMYAALARGDTRALQRVTAKGLCDDLIGRIAGRRAQNRADCTWTLHRYVGRPRVVSQRASVLPLEGEDQPGSRRSSMRQAVVKIRSVQSFVPSGVDGGTIGEEERWAAREKEVTEFVVIQQAIFRGKDQGWKVWGTTGETGMRDLKAMMAGKGKEEKDGNREQMGSRGGIA